MFIMALDVGPSYWLVQFSFSKRDGDQMQCTKNTNDNKRSMSRDPKTTVAAGQND